jgi:hypothetical protein
MAAPTLHLRNYLVLANEADLAALAAKTPYMRDHFEKMARSWRELEAYTVKTEANRKY